VINRSNTCHSFAGYSRNVTPLQNRGGRIRTAKTLDAETVLDTAARLVERGGFSVRGLADELGVAVTSIYWHVGGRDQLYDRLIDRLLAAMIDMPVDGADPVARIASVAHAQRRLLIEHQHLLALAHERGRTATLFLPIQQILAAQLALLGVTGERAALVLRAVQIHVISSAVMQFSTVRGDYHREPWTTDWPDQELVTALQTPTDYDAVFAYGLDALLAPLH
jgi:TetR/AcrR family transcriptional regulator, tetracycline repressor protein